LEDLIKVIVSIKWSNNLLQSPSIKPRN